MSIYSCSDKIDHLLEKGIPASPSFIPSLLKYFIRGIPWEKLSSNHPLNEDERQFLQDVKKDLKLLSENGNKESKQQKLADLIQKIKEYSTTCNNDGLKLILEDIADDLTVVKDGFRASSRYQNTKKPSIEKAFDDEYQALLNSKLLLTPLVQGKINELGNSPGDCYGFTRAMVDSNLSPYKNKDKSVEYNEAIYRYQQNQTDRIKDQTFIKSQRLTQKAFCPSLEKQAENLYRIASEHVEKDLDVHLQGKKGLHSTYLSLQKDGKIRYADSNHGVFLFNNKEEFLSKYQLMYRFDNKLDSDSAYTFFSVSLLQEDRNHEFSESNSLAGKWNSLMTGRKYKPEIDVPFDKLIFSLVGGVTGAAAGAAIGSVVPVIGTLLGGIIGAVAGIIATGVVVRRANDHGHFGLLGPYHYLRQTLYDAKESLKERLGLQPKCDETTQVLPESNSHAVMQQRLINPSENAVQFGSVSSSPNPNTPIAEHQNDSDLSVDGTINESQTTDEVHHSASPRG